MPIRRQNDKPSLLTIFSATGVVTLPEIIEIITAFQDEPPAENIIWDFSMAEVGDSYTWNDLEMTASLANAKLGLRPGGRTAFVATTDIVFGLIRMYTTFLEFQNIVHAVKIFREIDDAHQWLREDE